MNKYQEIIETIQDRFQEILTANGYWTDLGLHVYISKSNKIISAADESAINIVDVNAVVSGPRTGGLIQYFDHQYLIECTLHFVGGTAASMIRDGISDVMRAIGEDLTWNGLAIHTYPPEGSEFFTMVFDHEENIIIGARIFFIVEFRTSEWLITEHLLNPES